MPADYRDRLDLRAIIARIDRDRAEGEKLREETQKFVAEQHKLLSEQHKLMAERHKFNREIWIVPLTILGAIIAGVVARLMEILHAFGVGR